MQRQLGERFEPGILKIDVKFAFRGKKVKKKFVFEGVQENHHGNDNGNVAK